MDELMYHPWQIICSLVRKKCHLESYHSDMKYYHTRLNIIFSGAMSQRLWQRSQLSYWKGQSESEFLDAAPKVLQRTFSRPRHSYNPSLILAAILVRERGVSYNMWSTGGIRGVILRRSGSQIPHINEGSSMYERINLSHLTQECSTVFQHFRCLKFEKMTMLCG